MLSEWYIKYRTNGHHQIATYYDSQLPLVSCIFTMRVKSHLAASVRKLKQQVLFGSRTSNGDLAVNWSIIFMMSYRDCFGQS